MRTSERNTFHKGSRHSAVTVCLLLVMCLVFLTACGKDKKDDTVANVNTEETLTNTEVPTTESVIDTEEVVDAETEIETETEHVPAVLNLSLIHIQGIPLSVATTIAFSRLYGKEIRYCSNRKEVKDHGDTGILLGSKIKDGDRVVIIEDVTTSGKSIQETFPIIQAQGDVTILGLMVSLNRMEKGLETDKCALDEIQEKYGFPANAIVSMADVVECLYNRPCQGRLIIDEMCIRDRHQRRQQQQYLRQPGAFLHPQWRRLYSLQ